MKQNIAKPTTQTFNQVRAGARQGGRVDGGQAGWGENGRGAGERGEGCSGSESPPNDAIV